MSEVAGGNGCDDGYMRSNHLNQRCDFARMIHADFKNTKSRIAREPCQSERHAPVVVERFGRSVSLARGRKCNAQHFFSRGFAYTACHRNRLTGIPLARGAAHGF